MDYKEEIAKKQVEIKQLEKQQNEEMKKSFPNIVGKIYKPSATSIYKVREITHIFSLTHCMVDVINITTHNNQHVDIDTNFCVEIDIAEIKEVTEKEFDEKLEKAMNILCAHFSSKYIENKSKHN